MDAKRHTLVFRLRAFISLLTALSFLVMTLSGVILYIAPSSRLSNIRNWNIWTLSRDNWIAVHMSFSTAFVIAAIIHLWLNRKPLLYYLSVKTKVETLRGEWLAVIIVAGLITWGTLKPFEPFSSLIRQRNQFNKHLTIRQGESPSEISGSGQLTLDNYCHQIGLNTENAIAILRQEGIEADKHDTLRTLADRSGLHPSQLRRILNTVP